VSVKARFLANTVSCGVILASFLISTSSTLRDFALWRTSPNWLHTVAFMCGLALGMNFDRISTVFYGIGSMALIAVLIFSGVLISAALLSDTPVLDVVLLFAFQRSFPSFVSICVLGCVGAALSMVLKSLLGRL
jgi:hypothetical protein